MTYSVKEIFYTLQGEGAQSGRPAVFCRFAGCNLWSGRESHRATAVCRSAISIPSAFLQENMQAALRYCLEHPPVGNRLAPSVAITPN